VGILFLIVGAIAVAVYIVHSAYMAGHWVGYQRGYDDKTDFIQAVKKAEALKEQDGGRN